MIAGAALDVIAAAVDPFPTFFEILPQVADPATYPALFRAVGEDVTETASSDTDERMAEALFGICTVLDGVEALIRRTRRRRRTGR